MVLMFIGGSPNSTAGGLKTTTILVILLLLFKKQNSNNDIIFHGKKISNKLTLKAVKILLYTTLALLVGISIIRIIEPTSISAGDIVFECISAISTVGLTTGITPTLAIVSKLVLISLMYIGRVGILTIALLISSRNTDTSLKIEYPNTDIIVG